MTKPNGDRTEEVSALETKDPQTRSKITNAFDRIEKHPVRIVLFAIVALMAGIATIYNVWFREDNASSSAPETAASAAQDTSALTSVSGSVSGAIEPSTESTSSTSSPAAPTELPPQVGTCFSVDLVELPCSALHRYEVAQTGEGCTQSDAVQYLGGQPGLDVARIALTQATIGSVDTCLVSAVDSADVVTSVRDIFRGESSGAYRLCADESGAPRIVACSQPHTTEYVGSSRAPSPQDCLAAAEEYMGISYATVSATLQIMTFGANQGSSPDQPLCAVSVRTDGVVLTATIRGIRTRALPLTPR